MARFVLANRKSGKFGEHEKRMARSSTYNTLQTLNSVQILSDLEPENPAARRITVFDADPREIAYRQQNVSTDVILEPEILFWKQITPPQDFVDPPQGQAVISLAAAVSNFHINVTSGGRVAANALAILYSRGSSGSQQEEKVFTDAKGVATFSVPSGYVPAAAILIPLNAWSMILRAPADGAKVECPLLPSGPNGWWHDSMKVELSDAKRGAGVKIGHIDTGCGPHPNLANVTRIGAIIRNQRQFSASYADDVDDEGHGTHTAGIIAAEPSQAKEFVGMAPGSSLYSIRVFATANSGATNEDIADAIDYLTETEKVDLINLSLGGKIPSELVRDAIDAALEAGTLCVCAAGNNAGQINYPAAFQGAIAVSALGLAGWGPLGSLAASRLPSGADRFGGDNLYLANFSCFGSTLGGTAPGVGLISTVPDRFNGTAAHGSMDGTSMACPALCGTLATILARDSYYAQLPRDLTRSHAARTILAKHLIGTGLAPIYQGGGMLTY